MARGEDARTLGGHGFVRTANKRRFMDARYRPTNEQRRHAGLRVDISALKAAQAALHESEQRLDRAQEMTGIGSWEFDVQTGRHICSKELYRIRGILRDDDAPTVAAASRSSPTRMTAQVSLRGSTH